MLVNINQWINILDHFYQYINVEKFLIKYALVIHISHIYKYIYTYTYIHIELRVYNRVNGQMSTICDSCDKIIDLINSHINILTHIHTYGIVISKLYESISLYK